MVTHQLSYRQLYQILIAEQVCSTRRKTCDKNCEKCDLQIDSDELQTACKQLIEIVKAKDPFLYLSNELDDLRQLIIKGGNKE